MKPHRIVVMESPYNGDRQENLLYARRCMQDCLDRGEAPFASHLLYTQVLDDDVHDQRMQGIMCGLTFLRVAEASVVYTDRGISPGMQIGIKGARAMLKPVEFRKLNPGAPR